MERSFDLMIFGGTGDLSTRKLPLSRVRSGHRICHNGDSGELGGLVGQAVWENHLADDLRVSG